MIRLTHPEVVPNAVRRMRRSRGLTQVQLAAETGLTDMAVSLIELGKNRPRIDTLIRFADALGYDLALIPREDA